MTPTLSTRGDDLYAMQGHTRLVEAVLHRVPRGDEQRPPVTGLGQPPSGLVDDVNEGNAHRRLHGIGHEVHCDRADQDAVGSRILHSLSRRREIGSGGSQRPLVCISTMVAKFNERSTLSAEFSTPSRERIASLMRR